MMPKTPDSAMDMDRILQLAQTDAGRQLIAMFRSQAGSGLNSAMEKASAGDYSQLQASVREFMATPQARELVNKLRR